MKGLILSLSLLSIANMAKADLGENFCLNQLMQNTVAQAALIDEVKLRLNWGLFAHARHQGIALRTKYVTNGPSHPQTSESTVDLVFSVGPDGLTQITTVMKTVAQTVRGLDLLIQFSNDLHATSQAIEDKTICDYSLSFYNKKVSPTYGYPELFNVTGQDPVSLGKVFMPEMTGHKVSY